MTIRWADLAQLLQTTHGRDELGFALSGHMGFQTPAGEARLPYDAGGTVPALRRPRFTLQDIKVEEFRPRENRARVGINLGVTNFGGSTFSFQRFDYRLRFGGNDVASGMVDRLGEVAAEATGRLTLPVDVSLTGVGTSIIDAISRKGRLDARLEAGLEVGARLSRAIVDRPLERLRVAAVGFAGPGVLSGLPEHPCCLPHDAPAPQRIGARSPIQAWTMGGHL